MAVGLSISKSELDARAGEIAIGFQRHFRDVATLKKFLDETPDTELEALGYAPEEVPILKSAFADLAQLATIWTGTAPLTTAKDFRAFVSQLWGIGAF